MRTYQILTEKAVNEKLEMLCQYLYQDRTSNVPGYNRCYSKLKCVHIAVELHTKSLIIIK